VVFWEANWQLLLLKRVFFSFDYLGSGTKVVQVFPEDGNLGLILPRYLSEWTTSKVRAEGVTVKPKTQVSSASVVEDRVQLNLSNGETVEAVILSFI
jgi:programmed cell death 8 (apoptosis-inducing factor)